MRREFAKYFIIGISAFVLDLGSLFWLKERMGFSPVTAVIINQIFILNYVFFLNQRWSFRAKGATHKQIARFYLLALGNYLFSIFWMWLMHKQFNLNYLVARVANIIMAVAWNFFLYKYWIYRISQKPSAVENISDNSVLTS